MALNKLYYVYGLDTSCFYTDKENEIEKRIIKARCVRSKYKKRIENLENKVSKLSKKLQNAISEEEWTVLNIKQTELNNKLEFLKKAYATWFLKLNKYIGTNKQELKFELNQNVNLTRQVRLDKILDKQGLPSIKRRVSIFDSDLTRCLQMKEREFNEEIIIVKVYFFDVAESIVKNGFYLNGNKYVFFSASAGQIRTKKLVAVKEEILKKNWNTLTAGLTIDNINSQGGMNINKFLAYLALSNSATDLWEDFDIDRCIVVEDFENVVQGKVDFIDEQTYDITRQDMNITVTQTDGCGMVLPCVNTKNFMVRLPWMKGLLAVFDFIKFIKWHNASPVITDIYGNKHNIIEENIQIIFTKSQFKMWKYFKSWQEYKENFKKFGCSAGKCNEEENDFSEAVINYQMIQTLSDLSDEEIKALAKENHEDLTKLATDTTTMLKVFGVTKWNTNKTGFQKCLEKYPELLSDAYSRKTLRDLKTKLEKELWSGRFKINGKYTFVIPDLYAFCENLFLHIKEPKGLLSDGEVCCKLFADKERLDCLRSPHLYIEHPVRKNNINFNWFLTNAIYVSCHDLISKILQFDSDGDKLLLTDNKTLIQAAERDMTDIVPLYYNMGKAQAEILTSDSLFKGLKLAYTGGNIGSPSNDITKIWNSGIISDEQLKVIKWLCCEVNFIIDYSKTLYKPIRPRFAHNIISKYTKSKVPYFFKYAKDKTQKQVKEKSECTVDRIKKLYPRRKLQYNFTQRNLGKFDYRFLMRDKEVEIVPQIMETYSKITSALNFNNVSDDKMKNYVAVFDEAKTQILNLPYDNSVIIDNIIYGLFAVKKTHLKKAFWFMFGEEVYQNLCDNIDNNFIMCEHCKKRFFRTKITQKKCSECVGYQKQNTKTITCIDCGKEVEVNGIVKNKKRCDECQREYIKKYDRERKAKLKENSVF